MLDSASRLELEADDTSFVRLTWADANGIFRGEGIHVSQDRALCDAGLGVVTGIMGTTSNDQIPPGLEVGAVGQVWLRGDEQSLRQLPWNPGHVSMMGDLVKADGSPWSCCPRQTLRRQVLRLQQMGLRLQVGFEPEFTLLSQSSSGDFHPADIWHYASVHALNAQSPLLMDMVEALQAQGIEVRTLMAESGSGQYEMSVGHDAPLVTADRMLVVRETIAAVARQHEMVATMLPKVLEDEAGNGCHVHLSLWREGTNCMSDGPQSFTPEAEAFVAGLLEHLPALMALTAPSPASARRIAPGTWSGAFACWGWDNKEAPLRAVSEPGQNASPQHVEFKSFDATCNPHLALAGIIACGIDGMERELKLPAALQVDPASLPAPPAPLPTSVEAWVASLETDCVLKEALGDDLHAVCCAVRRLEAAHFEGASLESMVSALASTW
ncbi:MAG: glutamine synthetase family protein [Phycisphaerales bacterium]|nr:glutamine synthetase family protein [Phycisphaerales bacterium]